MLGYFTAGRKSGVGITAAILGLLIWSGSQVRGSEIPVSLTDLSSTVQVYSQSNAGMGSWTVGAVSELSREWFWYSVGTVGSSNPEQAINTLTCTLDNPSATYVSTGYDTLNQEFTKSGQFKIDLTYLLTGSSGASSDVSLQIAITNLGSTSLSFHFFQLAEFGLGGSSSSNTAQVTTNSHGYYVSASQQGGGTTLSFTASPGANRAQVGIYPAIYNLLTSSQGANLNNSAGPAGPGNTEWALQWDLTIAGNGTTTITEDQNMSLPVVPEPATLSLLALGGLALLRRKN